MLERGGDTPDVDREDLVELVEVELVRVAPRWHDARIRDHDVEPAELLDGPVHGLRDLGLDAHVGREGGPASGRWTLREIDDGARRAGSRELTGNRGAEAARAARDERDAPGQQASCSRYVAAFA